MICLGVVAFLTISLDAFGQQRSIITDMETGISYFTEMLSVNGNPGFAENPRRIVGSERAVFVIMNNPEAVERIGGYLYRGPSERIPTGPFGEDGMSIKICHNTNIWPCMWVRNPNK